MKSSEDRRAPHVRRVSLTTLVDICSQKGEPTPFQAESANLSGRGMHVRTSYLPDVGEELVCRLNHEDQEILVEGRVAWRSEGPDSGEFGIQFTALDADSAHVLTSLGEKVKGERRSSPIPPEVLDDEEGGIDVFSEGARVKLHIEGLGAPMKACVHGGTTRKLKVGSSLEFLKMGRDLEVEDVGAGARRGASVDSVNVVINPVTSVPELVVQLRYEGMSPTPLPEKATDARPDYDDEAFSAGPRGVDGDDEVSSDLSDEEAAPWEPAAEALRARLAGAMKSAGQAASKAGSILGSAAMSARTSVAKAAARRTQGGGTLRRQQSPEQRRRQTTRRSHVAPSHLRSGIHDLGLAKKQSAGPSPSVKTGRQIAKKPKRRLSPAALLGVAFLVFGGSAFALRTMGADRPVEAPEKTAHAEARPDARKSIQEKPKIAKKADVKEDGVVAEVPLFGPQAMALKPAERVEETIDVAEAERRSAAAAVEDQTWEDSAEKAQEEQVTPWGRGRLYLPTIHRVRLDGVGAALSGAVNQDGFTVVVPGRKAMESGKAIEKRDKRIIAVSTSNGARGASIKFEFRGSVPPYRVRLRKDFVEFLISAPEDTVARL